MDNQTSGGARTAQAAAKQRSSQKVAPPRPAAPPVAVKDLKVLVASHSHPRITRGGAEIAAYHLFSTLSARPGYKAWFFGCQHAPTSERLGVSFTQPHGDQEFLYSVGSFDWFKFANRDARFPKAFSALIANLRPDVVHFHHFINFGVEAFLHVKNVSPDIKIVLTVHEYLLICHHYGQMVTKQNQNLCYAAELEKCNKCFPEFSPSDFFLRKRYLLRFIDLVDHFIAPSHFLAERLVQWGVAENKITVLENVIPRPDYKGKSTTRHGAGTLRVGFFGQISKLKGINVIFDAAAALDREENTDIVFDIYGEYRGQPPEFQKDFLERLEKIGPNVRFHGPYEPTQVDRLMQTVDVTIVPSIWWENSPVVIQEAFRNRRPVICSDIGGMAEKVRDGLDGWHFATGSSMALVALLKHLSENPDVVAKASAEMRLPVEAESITEAHCRLYETLTQGF